MPRRAPRRWVTAVKVLVAVAGLWYFAHLVRRVDWPHVGESLARLNGWQAAVLVGLALLRQVVGSTPLALYIPGLRLRRALVNDLSATVVASVAPPPADIAVRLAMFRSWRIDASRGASGLTLNTLSFFAARFGAPVAGFVLALATGLARTGYAWTALSSGAVSVAIVAALWVVSRGRSVAAAAARWTGRLAHRASPARVDPEAWSRAVAVFQQQSGELLRSRSRSVAPVLAALLLLEGLVLVLCLRFVGVPAERASVAVVLVAFLVSFPLTTLPFNGLGALDAAIVGILTGEGVTDTSAEVAALVVWRVCLLLLPLLLGVGSLLLWRRQRAAAPAA